MKPRIWLAIGWTVLMLVVCWLPPTRLPVAEERAAMMWIPHLDKVVHGGIFAVFAVLWRRALTEKSATAIAVAGMILAVVTELGQATSFVGRDADLWDGFADSVGLLIGLAVGAWVCRPRARVEPSSGL